MEAQMKEREKMAHAVIIRQRAKEILKRKRSQSIDLHKFVKRLNGEGTSLAFIKKSLVDMPYSGLALYSWGDIVEVTFASNLQYCPEPHQRGMLECLMRSTDMSTPTTRFWIKAMKKALNKGVLSVQELREEYSDLMSTELHVGWAIPTLVYPWRCMSVKREEREVLISPYFKKVR
ncbi:MAG: hypothetical protein ACQEP6_00225 [Patescibacteria group bacterium]